MKDEELTRLAEEEILKETKRASVRAEVAGPQGWSKCKIPSTNKRFLRNTLLSTVNVNIRKKQNSQQCSRDGQHLKDSNKRSSRDKNTDSEQRNGKKHKCDDKKNDNFVNNSKCADKTKT